MVKRDGHDGGFTLPELLVVITLIGVLAVVIAGVFSVVTRSTPSTEARTDDSRSLLSLTNWLSQDVTSTAETGFDKAELGVYDDGQPTGCDPDSVPVATSFPLVQLQWSDAGSDFVADYRYVRNGDGTGTINRYACLLGGTAEAHKLTATLRDRTSGDLAPAPVSVTLIDSVTAEGAPAHKGLQFSVYVFEDDGTQRELLALDAATSNIHTTLPPPGSAPPGEQTNLPPEVPAAISDELDAGSPEKAYELHYTDPNGDELMLTFANPLPAWARVEGRHLIVTPPSIESVTEPLTYSSQYDVSDGEFTVSNTVQLSILVVDDGGEEPPSNLPPTITPLTAVLAYPGESFTVTVNATDPESQPLSIPEVTQLAGPTGEWSAPSVAGMTVTFNPTASAGTDSTFEVSVTDGLNVAKVQLNVRFCVARITSVNPATVQVNTSSHKLDNHVTVTISHNGACGPLVLQYLSTVAATAKSQPFGSSTTVTIDKNNPSDWDSPPTGGRNVDLELRQGIDGKILHVAILRTIPK